MTTTAKERTIEEILADIEEVIAELRAIIGSKP